MSLDVAPLVHNHTGAGTSVADAADVDYDGTASGLAATDVQAALDEVDGDLDAHLADATAAHAGSAVSFSAAGLAVITGVDVQAALAAVDAALDDRPTNAEASAAYAAKADLPVLYLSGTAGNYPSTPDHADISVTGDIDLRVDVALDDWTPAAQGYLINKNNFGSDRSYYFYVTTDGKLVLTVSPDGTAGTLKIATSTVAVAATAGVSDGGRLQVRVTLDVDNGAAGYDVKFYYRTDGDIESSTGWTQLGTTVTGAGTTSIFNGTQDLVVGNNPNGNAIIGRVYRAQVYSGIGGTLAADFRGDLGNVGPRYRDSTGKVWTFNGSAYSWTER